MNSKHNRALLISLVAAIGILIPSTAAAADLEITDLEGNVIQVRNVRIDYTSYSFIYTPDFESSGIRAYQGRGVVTVNWERIEEVTIIGKKTDATPYRLKAEVTLAGGEPKPLELKMNSKKGLVGETDLGQFSVDLEHIKKIVVVKETKTKE